MAAAPFMTNPDWPVIVAELINRLSRAEVARLTGAGPSTLTSLMNGSSGEPRYRLGVQLLGLHKRVQASSKRAALKRTG